MKSDLARGVAAVAMVFAFAAVVVLHAANTEHRTGLFAANLAVGAAQTVTTQLDAAFPTGPAYQQGGAPGHNPMLDAPAPKVAEHIRAPLLPSAGATVTDAEMGAKNAQELDQYNHPGNVQNFQVAPPPGQAAPGFSGQALTAASPEVSNNVGPVFKVNPPPGGAQAQVLSAPQQNQATLGPIQGPAGAAPSAFQVAPPPGQPAQFNAAAPPPAAAGAAPAVAHAPLVKAVPEKGYNAMTYNQLVKAAAAKARIAKKPTAVKPKANVAVKPATNTAVVPAANAVAVAKQPTPVFDYAYKGRIYKPTPAPTVGFPIVFLFANNESDETYYFAMRQPDGLLHVFNKIPPHDRARQPAFANEDWTIVNAKKVQSTRVQPFEVTYKNQWVTIPAA